MTWSLKSRADREKYFDSLIIKEVLYFYDEPLIFSANVPGGLVVSVLIDEIDSSNVYLVAPTNQNIIENLKSGAISVRSAFLLNWLWIVQCDMELNVEKTWSTSIEQIGDDILPDKNVGLYPHFGSIAESSPANIVADPFLGVHFSGGDLGDSIPFMDFKNIIDHTYSSLRSLFTNAFSEQITEQRITEGLVNRILQMPIREPKFASLSLELEKPTLNFSRIKKTLEIDREKIIENLDRVNETFLSSISKLSRFSEKEGNISFDYEIGRLLNDILPDENTRYDMLAFYGSSRKERFVFDRGLGVRIKSEFSTLSDKIRKISGRVVEVNIPSKTFLLEGKIGSITTCRLKHELWEKYFSDLKRVYGEMQEIAVYADIQNRKRRALADVERIDF